MLILADENMPLAAELFGRHGEVRLKAGRSMTPADVAHADALLVRSVTRVDAALLAGSPLRFVGSATIGMDHLDLPWLEGQGIAYANAPGCNAEAVAEYVLASLLVLAERDGWRLEDKSLAIVGVGHVGRALRRKLAALGLRLVLVDPFRAEHETGFSPLDEALACDIVSLHVPLTKTGPHPTWHLFDAARIAALKPGAILINAARGAVVDNQALKAALKAKQRLSVVLDVFENEPRIDAELVPLLDLATPHIAGYSLDGKLRGSLMVYAAFCRHFGIPAVTPELAELDMPALPAVHSASLAQAVWACYDPRRDDADLRASLAEPEPALAFDRLRKNYPPRREFPALEVQGVAAGWVDTLGFKRG
ncbi:MAG: 4-phosphoerythronate dehydrogenase [Gammaproteobacteria bacterium]|nr:4-phosphoerythronate dehydrogenase [Gammaproteobacteria bacterium]